jgi:hypothetical protein
MASNGIKASEAELIILSRKKNMRLHCENSTRNRKEGRPRTFLQKLKINHENCDMECVPWAHF